MPIAALVLYVVWFALAFGLRTVIHLRRTGASGFKGVGGRPGSLEWLAGALFSVALVVGVAGPVAALVGLAPLVDAEWLRWSGVAVAAFGIVLTQDETIPAVDLAEMQEAVKLLPEEAMRSPGAFGPAIEVAEEASAQDVLIAFLGRRP